MFILYKGLVNIQNIQKGFFKMTIIAIPTNNTGFKSETPGRGQNAAYSKYVAAAGFTPILVPMEANLNEIASVADGLLLAGGVDIDPLHYGFSNFASYNVDPRKDAAERGLFHAFRQLNKPVFGICRGFQLIFREYIAVAEMEANYLEYMEHAGKHAQGDLNVRRSIPTHMVRVNTEGLYGEAVEGNPLKMQPVNSMHHQVAIYNHGMVHKEAGIDMKNLDRNEPVIHEVGNFELVAWTLRGVQQPVYNKKPDYDNYWCIIEAMRIHNWGGAIMGVQWHPEELQDGRLLKNFFTPPNGAEIAEEIGI